ncbi:MAG TPA: dTMP kinase [Thermoplasmataceae archaeon]|nr:dTMP kinase [Thermoplasmataceae archaeon]
MFISIEGIDGSGKTSLSSKLSEALSKQGHRVFLTKEPTDKMHRNHALERSREPIDAMKLFFEFTIDRMTHQSEIAEKISQGYIVISDRYIYSSFAYQGAVLDKHFGDLKRTIEWMECVSEIIKIRPDVNIILDIDPKRSMERLTHRSSFGGFEEAEFLEKVRRYYQDIKRNNDVVIDATLPRETVLSMALDAVRSLMPL